MKNILVIIVALAIIIVAGLGMHHLAFVDQWSSADYLLTIVCGLIIGVMLNGKYNQ
jgi:uncharacterized protein YxeA